MVVSRNMSLAVCKAAEPIDTPARSKLGGNSAGGSYLVE